MSTLYLRIPSKAVADNTSGLPSLPCPFALVLHGGAIERQGISSLPELADTIAKAQRVVILLAASDVTLLRVKIPPLSPAKLKAALPNLIEEQLIADPSDCVVVAGDASEGLRTVAVTQRAWLDLVTTTLFSLGARHIAAVPAQLCLPYQLNQPDSVSAAINESSGSLDMTLRLPGQDGIGLLIAHENAEPAAQAAIRTLCALVPQAPITLYVPPSQINIYQKEIDGSDALSKRITVSADSWPRWVTGASATTLDLMAGLNKGTGPKLDWRPWRWPLALAATVLLINVVALNIDWWHMKNEAAMQRSAMIQIYKSAYPKESVIIDPIAQMQQKISIAKHASGLPAPDDFTTITAVFGSAWAEVMPTMAATSALAALEYRERSLFVRLKQGGAAPTQQMQTALEKHHLTLDLVPEQSGMTVWKIGSAK